jgi:hypothetical protein
MIVMATDLFLRIDTYRLVSLCLMVVMVHTRGRQTMSDQASSRLDQIRAKHGERWHIERTGSVWTAIEHPSPTALHIIVAHDLDALAQKITESERRD